MQRESAMWHPILLQAAILAVLVSAEYNEPISREVNIQHGEQKESIQINVTLAPHWLKDAPTQHKAEFKATRLSGPTQFNYRIDIQQWRLSDPPDSNGHATLYMNDSMSWPAAEKETEWRSATGSRYFWYRFDSNRCDAILMRVQINGTNPNTLDFQLKPDGFRMLRIHSRCTIRKHAIHSFRIATMYDYSLYELRPCMYLTVRNSINLASSAFNHFSIRNTLKSII